MYIYNFYKNLKWIDRKEEEEIINIYDDCILLLIQFKTMSDRIFNENIFFNKNMRENVVGWASRRKWIVTQNNDSM